MTTRYLTTDDVRRANTRELVVEEGTVVTPQALEFAAANGITIRSSSGSYSEPAPNRGPDAERAIRSLPHLPEPEGDADVGSTQMIVVTAVGRNRPGVLAEITNTLAAANASVHDISQKMIEDFFHMVVTVEVPPGSSFADLKARLECLGGPTTTSAA